MELADLLLSYPILESCISQLSFQDLLNLSRTSSLYRAVLHGFDPPRSMPRLMVSSKVRADLHLGRANTQLWKHMKSICHCECSEAGHTKGAKPKGCRMCSMPVCDTCVVKQSFGKRENTFGNRRRQLCDQCWLSGNPHEQRLHFNDDTVITLDYTTCGLCRCTARDGLLCAACKHSQNDPSMAKHVRCSGRGCSRLLGSEEEGGRVCLWCNLILPGPRSKGEDQRRREYESKYEKKPDSQTHIILDTRPRPMDLFGQRVPVPPRFNDRTILPRTAQPTQNQQDPTSYEEHERDLLLPDTP